MKNDEFDKLFVYMQDFRKEVSGEFLHVNEQIDSLERVVDNYARHADTY